MTADWLVPLPLVVPLLMAALLVGAAPLLRDSVASVLGILAALAAAACCCALLVQASHGTLVYWFGGWQPRDGLPIGISFVIDPLGAGMALLAALLVTAALIYAWSYLKSYGTLFHALMLVFLGAMVGFCLTGDLFNLFVFFELMSVAAYALTGYKIEERGPIQGALNFAVSNSLGAFLVLYGIGLLYGRTGALNLAQIGRQLSTQPLDSLVLVAFTLIGVGLFVKAAVVPFHFWLADAHAVAPTPVCVLFSGVMVELGLYGFLRIYWTVFASSLAPHAEGVRMVLLGAGVLTALLGGTMCYLQRHVKRLLAYSTVSHAGAFLLGAASLSPTGLAGVALYVLGHGLIKGALFMVAGILLDRFSSVDEIELAGKGRAVPPAGLLFGLGGLALAGCPLFVSATGKSLIEEGFVDWPAAVILATLVASGVLTGGALLRVTLRVFYGVGRDVRDAAARAPTHGEEEREGRDERPTGVPWGMLAPAIVLMVLALGLGVVQTPLGQAESASRQFMDQSAYIGVVLSGQAAEVHSAMEEVRPSSAALLWGLVSTLGAVVVATAALGVVRVPLGGWLGTGVERIARPLRNAHSGLVGDYAAWLLLGTVAFGAAYSVVLRQG